MRSTAEASAWRGAAISAGLHAAALTLILAAAGGGAAVVDAGEGTVAVSVAVVGPDALAPPPAPTPESAAAESEQPAPPHPESEADTQPKAEPEAEPRMAEPVPPEATEWMLTSANQTDAVLPTPKPEPPEDRPAKPEDARPAKPAEAQAQPEPDEAAEAEAQPESAEPAPETAAAPSPQTVAPDGAGGAGAPGQTAALPLEGSSDGVAPPVVTEPRFRSPPAPPDYPQPAVRRSLEGVVVVRALVGPSGEAAETKVWRSSGHSMLDDAALEAVRRWDFEPAKRAGRAITAWVEVPVEFSLR